MKWSILVSCYILRGMLLSADHYEEFKKELDRLIDDALIVRHESGQGLVLVNLFRRYVHCDVLIDDEQNLVIQHSREDDIFYSVANYKDEYQKEKYYPEWYDVNKKLYIIQHDKVSMKDMYGEKTSYKR